jgi:hypothetical protein
MRIRLQELEAAQKETEAQFHRIAGAIALLRELLAEAEKSEEKTE